MERTMLIARNGLFGFGTVLAVLVAGCGGESTAPKSASSEGGAVSIETTPAAPASPGSGALPTATISAGSPATPDLDSEEAKAAAAANQREASAPPEKGSPRWLVLEMTKLRMQPFPETDDIEKQREARRTRNQEIVKLAEEAIAKTHQDPEREAVFNVAVHRLMESLLALSLQGDQDSIDSLFSFADSFYKRDPKSRAASESAYILARFVHKNAQYSGSEDVRYIQEFSRQARLFAERFPDEQERAVELLNDAGATCDFYGMREEAILCFETLRQKYADTPQAQQTIPVLRRLNLIGKPLDLGGPTLDGGFISVADFKGSPVLVVFWSSQAAPFVEHAASIIATTEKFEQQGLQVMGVNLDTDELAIDAFLEKFSMSWRTVFHADRDRRGWNHPVAVHYGVTTIPQIWLVDAEGKAVTTSIAPKDLDATLTKLLPASK
jgi:peroxiredoxin